MKQIRNIPINFFVFFCGLALFAGGIYLIYPPGAPIGAGLILMGISLFGERKQ
jgi:hypothetical protein